MTPYQLATRTYFQILLTWRGRPSKKVSVGQAISALRGALKAVPLSDPFYLKIAGLLNDIVLNATASDDEAVA